MNVLRVSLFCVSGFLAVLCCGARIASAATATFDDLAQGALALPGSFTSGGIDVALSGSGRASIASFGAVGQSLQLTLGAAASFDVPAGANSGAFSYYNVVSTLPSLMINGDSISFGGLAGTSGTLGGVNYSVTANPWSSFDQVTLSGPISNFSVVSGSSPNALIMDEVTFVPEPASIWLLGVAAMALCRRGRRAD
jgi:hypothetical protein